MTGQPPAPHDGADDEAGRVSTGINPPPGGILRPQSTLPWPPNDVDIYKAQTARMADYLLGGKDNFSVDRDVIEYVTGALPGGSDTARFTLSVAQAFVGRVVRHIAAEAGIHQYVNVGTSLPTGTKVHEAVRETGPDWWRVLYVVNDSVVLAHAHELRESASNGASTFVRGSLEDPETVLLPAGEYLDFRQPVAVIILSGGLNVISDDREARRCVAQLVDALPSGSYLVTTHLGRDMLGDAMNEAIQRLHDMVEQQRMPPVTLRTSAEVARFFDGMELVEPGVVPVDQWRPDDPAAAPAGEPKTFIYGAVGRKP